MDPRNNLVLYFVRFRTSESAAARELSPLDRVHGWRDWQNPRREPIVLNEGHEAGSLHSRQASHVLTWNPEPGDLIEAEILVEYFDSDSGDACWTQTACASAIGDYGEFVIEADTVLGRAPMLAEDTAADSFGHDAVREQIEAGLRGDWRKIPCEMRLRPRGDNEKVTRSAHVAAALANEAEISGDL